MSNRSPKPFDTPFGLDDLVAETRARRDRDLQLLGALLGLVRFGLQLPRTR